MFSSSNTEFPSCCALLKKLLVPEVAPDVVHRVQPTLCRLAVSAAQDLNNSTHLYLTKTAVCIYQGRSRPTFSQYVNVTIFSLALSKSQ